MPSNISSIEQTRFTPEHGPTKNVLEPDLSSRPGPVSMLVSVTGDDELVLLSAGESAGRDSSDPVSGKAKIRSISVWVVSGKSCRTRPRNARTCRACSSSSRTRCVGGL